MDDLWKLETLKSGDLTLIILPGIGGRLWDVQFKGQSLFFQNTDLLGHAPDLENPTSLPTRSPHFKFPLWGGEKTWIAPDTAWANDAPFPVLDSGAYAIFKSDDHQIALQSGICPLSHLQISRTISIGDEDQFSIHHNITNTGDQARLTGIWSVMMLDHPACIAVGGEKLTSTPVFGDAGDQLIHKTAGLICNCQTRGEFKLGLDNPEGRTLVQTGTAVMLCETQPPQPSDTFAHTFPLEIFNSGDYPYCEAEWHSPATMLDAHQTITFDQRFTIWSDPKTTNSIALSAGKKELLECMS
ncbi:hypothetical protein [Sulfitobacter sp.]|uniref:hypothetical protein n=1 Tax=Sulfitobacter sp. TaxID=1903071 RepID=UPI003002AEC2